VTTPLYVFDIDGTLLRADGAGARAFDHALGEVFGLAGAGAGVRFGGKTDPMILAEILAAGGHAPASSQQWERFQATYLPALERELHAAPGFRVLPGVADALAFLDERALPRGIGTGNVAAGARAKLTRAGLADRFAFGGYACDAPRRADLIAIAIARGRALLPTGPAIVVGDTVHDVDAAHACGAIMIAVTTGADDEATLRGRLGPADVLLPDLSHLPAWHAARGYA
jgi:phosphoglycolate phosphatase